MMVPRHYALYSSSPPKDRFNEKGPVTPRTAKKSTPPRTAERVPSVKPTSPEHATSPPESMRAVSQPVPVPAPAQSQLAKTNTHSMPSRARNVPGRGSRKAPAAHNPDAMPPAVAALLAMTAIPPPRPNQFKRKSHEQRRVSIDELVNEWKSDDTWKASSYSGSPALSVLLEDASDGEEQSVSMDEHTPDDRLVHTRSTSSDSVPSLEADDFSLGSPSMPESLHSRKSSSNLRRDRAMSQVVTEDSSYDHPLGPAPLPEDDDNLLLSPPSKVTPPKPRSSFKSNLTTSLRALRKSFGSFSLNNATAPAQRQPASPSPFSDQMLWSHPALFPRFSSEVRPSIEGIPTESQRRYLNPVPALTFEEQEAPFQQALHAPYLAEPVDDVPHIQMRTYTRGRRRSSKRGGAGTDPSSEAGRALVNASGMRQREPRENSDFLRVVVLEMNMRREGKLSSGRAKIWLPPRVPCLPDEREEEEEEEEEEVGGKEKVPSRWVGVSAY